MLDSGRSLSCFMTGTGSCEPVRWPPSKMPDAFSSREEPWAVCADEAAVAATATRAAAVAIHPRRADLGRAEPAERAIVFKVSVLKEQDCGVVGWGGFSFAVTTVSSKETEWQVVYWCALAVSLLPLLRPAGSRGSRIYSVSPVPRRADEFKAAGRCWRGDVKGYACSSAVREGE